MADTTEEQKKAVLPFLQVNSESAERERERINVIKLDDDGRAEKRKLDLDLPLQKKKLTLSSPPTPHSSLSLFFFSTHQRAEEIEKVEPKIAYYCRMYAVEQVRAIGAARTPVRT